MEMFHFHMPLLYQSTVAQNNPTKPYMGKQEEPEEAPPFFKSWKTAYLVVLGNLLFLIVAFYFFTKLFE